MTPTRSQFSVSTLRFSDGTILSSVHPAVEEMGVKASIHSCPCESSIEIVPVDDVILSNNSFVDEVSVVLYDL